MMNRETFSRCNHCDRHGAITVISDTFTFKTISIRPPAVPCVHCGDYACSPTCAGECPAQGRKASLFRHIPAFPGGARGAPNYGYHSIPDREGNLVSLP